MNITPAMIEAAARKLAHRDVFNESRWPEYAAIAESALSAALGEPEPTGSRILNPKGEDAATVLFHSDRRPATVVKRTEKTVWIQRDKAEHFSTVESIKSGVPFAQGHGDYVVFTRDENAPIEVYTKRQTGHWVKQGQPSKGRGNGLWLGVRADYTDPHF